MTSIDAGLFIDALRERSFSQFCGVPCSFLKPLINRVISDPRLGYNGASSEGEAVGINFGAYLAGRKCVTLCQNSGLGNTVNPLVSLNVPFRVPTLLITTWRGEPGLKDEPQHEHMGRITHRLLDALEIPWLPFPRSVEEIGTVLTTAEAHMNSNCLPFALVMSEGSVKESPLLQHSKSHPHNAVPHISSGPMNLTRSEALRIILENLNGDEAIIATTGKTGRELFTIADRSNHLYVVGGMGTASAIGFGVAHSLAFKKVVVIDGDGAALMKLGNLPTIGFYQPKHFLHIVLDNEAHDSTGGQTTSSSVVQFAMVAAACNYASAFAVSSTDDFISALRESNKREGPIMIHLKIRPGSPEKLGRPTVKPHEVKERFMQFLQQPIAPPK